MRLDHCCCRELCCSLASLRALKSCAAAADALFMSEKKLGKLAKLDCEAGVWCCACACELQLKPKLF